MSENKNIQDRIDDYIRGTMSMDNQVIFMDELRQDAELKHEVEVQMSIADAVQANHLKQMLQEVEIGLLGQKTHPVVERRLWSVFWGRWYQWACIAAVVVCIFVGNSFRQAHRIKGFGSEYFAMLSAPIARDGNTIDKLLSDSFNLIGANEYDSAQSSLGEARRLINQGLSAPVLDEETEYEHKILMEKQFDVEWYESIIQMRQGHYRKAKSSLLVIAKSSSPYADYAQIILGKMFNSNI